VSKVAQDLLAYQYFRSYGIPCWRARAFSHDGRGAESVRDFRVRQTVAEIELGLRNRCLGNLKARRDYTGVRDIVRGYWLLLEKGAPGDVILLSNPAPFKKFWISSGGSTARPIEVETRRGCVRPISRIFMVPGRITPPRAGGRRFRLSRCWACWSIGAGGAEMRHRMTVRPDPRCQPLADESRFASPGNPLKIEDECREDAVLEAGPTLRNHCGATLFRRPALNQSDAAGRFGPSASSGALPGHGGIADSAPVPARLKMRRPATPGSCSETRPV
jgi:hypothetical protein